MNESNRGQEMEQSQNLETALIEIQARIAQDPRNSLLHFELGILYFDRGEYRNACDSFQKTLELQPDFREAAWEMGSTFSRLGDTQGAVDAYLHALDIDPCCIQALFGLGNAYRRLGNYAEAIEYYKDIIYLNPALDRSDPRTEDADARSIVIQVHYNLGVTCLMAKDSENAKAAFQTVQSLDPRHPLAERAGGFLEDLSDPDFQLDSIKWNAIEIPSEDL